MAPPPPHHWYFPPIIWHHSQPNTCAFSPIYGTTPNPLLVLFQRGSTEEMFWTCDFFDANHVWLTKLNGPQSLGAIGPPQWSGQKSSSNFGTEFPHYRSPRPSQGLFSSQNKTGELPLLLCISLAFKKYIWWRLVFHLFGTPFAGFL